MVGLAGGVHPGGGAGVAEPAIAHAATVAADARDCALRRHVRADHRCPGCGWTQLYVGRRAGQPQVLFFFTTTCPYCRRSAPTVVRAARQLQANLPGRPQLLGVCHCDPAQAARYAHVHGFDFPVVTLTDRRALMLFRARNVPLVMAVDGEGRVRHSHVGLFDTTERVQDLVAALRRTDAPAALATVKE